MSVSNKNKYLMISLFILLIIFFFADILFGSVSIPAKEIFNIITGGASANSTWGTIITQFRLPKAITAVLAGSALSVCGLLMQTYFRNPLADPFVLGISSGASLGVAIVVLTAGTFGINLYFLGNIASNLSITVAAAIGASVILLIITAVARKINNNVTLLILGLMLGYIISSIENILKFFSAAENLQGYVIWGMGNLGNVVWNDLYFLMPIIAGALVVSFLMSKKLNLLLLGENYALSLGVNIKTIRLAVIVTGGILGGVITAYCGPIAFIGIAVPHLTRNLFNEFDHKILIPAVALAGSILTLICDVISQLPGSNQTIPISAVTSLVGAPVVIWIIIKQRKMKHSFKME